MAAPPPALATLNGGGGSLALAHANQLSGLGTTAPGLNLFPAGGLGGLGHSPLAAPLGSQRFASTPLWPPNASLAEMADGIRRRWSFQFPELMGSTDYQAIDWYIKRGG